MAYFLDLFSPQTYEAFRRSDRTISGFRESQRSAASAVKAGDQLLCYLTGLSRWCGILEVTSGPVIDRSPIFQQDDDPFVVRFLVRPRIVLEPEKSIPIQDDAVWNGLSFTKG